MLDHTCGRDNRDQLQAVQTSGPATQVDRCAHPRPTVRQFGGTVTAEQEPGWKEVVASNHGQWWKDAIIRVPRKSQLRNRNMQRRQAQGDQQQQHAP